VGVGVTSSRWPLLEPQQAPGAGELEGHVVGQIGEMARTEWVRASARRQHRLAIQPEEEVLESGVDRRRRPAAGRDV
jgi:hypothetical protein